jgi:hypothetical protein
MASAWKPAADPVLGSYRSFGSVSSIPQQQQQQHQQQQQQKGGKGRRRGQQEEDIPKQYATSTVFFAGVSPIATEAGLASVFEQFGNIIKVNLFRPYKTCKTSKVCTECRIGAGWGGGGGSQKLNGRVFRAVKSNLVLPVAGYLSSVCMQQCARSCSQLFPSSATA